MRNVSANKHRGGARVAAGARRLLAARVLAFLAILFLALPVSDVFAGHSHDHGLASSHSLHGSLPEAPPSPDEGIAHQCAQCACHQLMAVENRLLPETEQVSEVHFPLLERATCERATAPPHKPPRA